MNHEECLDALHDHHFGELDRVTDDHVRAHLAECSDCALEYCRLRADLDRLGALQTARPSAAVRATLRARVEAEFTPTLYDRIRAFFAAPVPIYQPAMVLALVVAVVAVAWPSDSTTSVPTSNPTVVDDFDGADLRIVDHRVL